MFGSKKQASGLRSVDLGFSVRAIFAGSLVVFIAIKAYESATQYHNVGDLPLMTVAWLVVFGCLYGTWRGLRFFLRCYNNPGKDLRGIAVLLLIFASALFLAYNSNGEASTAFNDRGALTSLLIATAVVVFGLFVIHEGRRSSSRPVQPPVLQHS